MARKRLLNEKEGKPYARLSSVLTEGVEPSSAAMLPAVLPLDHASIRKAPPTNRGAWIQAFSFNFLFKIPMNFIAYSLSSPTKLSSQSEDNNSISDVINSVNEKISSESNEVSSNISIRVFMLSHIQKAATLYFDFRFYFTTVLAVGDVDNFIAL